MEFNERLAELAAKVRNQREAIKTEEAAKVAFIMPFISSVLGYDVFDPHEVVPEFTADVGLKRGEKIDYAILRDGNVQLLVECKKTNAPLTIEHASQLYRYFAVTDARIAILTNGEIYQFYTDLDAPNRMDDKPFLVLDLTDIDETLLPELSKLAKDSFDLTSIISAAEELKYVGQIKRMIASQFKQPEDDWVRFFTTRVHNGSITQRVRDQFAPLVMKAASQFLNDQVNGRLKSALTFSLPSPDEDEPAESVVTDAPDKSNVDFKLETTVEEINGFRIIQAIACAEVKPHRIVYRDAKSYFAVLLDDNNRKTIARLHFNGRSRKHLGTFDSDKNETRHLITSMEDIYLHSEEIRAAVRRYDAANLDES